MRLLKENVIASVIYLALLFISENFALFYEVQPVIWPASAAFLAVSLAYGQKALFGPLICSFIYISLDVQPASEKLGLGFSTSVAAFMTLLNYLRVWVLLKLTDKFIGKENLSLKSPKLMLRFLIIAGPIGGTLGALLVLPALINVPDMTYSFRIFLFMRWWLAMTTGGIIFTPILLMILQKPERNPIPRRIYLLTSFGAVALMFGMLWFIRSALLIEIQQYDQEISRQSEMGIQDHFLKVEDLTNSLRAAIILKPDMTATEFDKVANELVGHRSGTVDFLSWSPIVLHDQRLKYETENNCSINMLTNNGLVPAIDQNSYVPVHYLHPAGIADTVLCFDLLSESRRHDGVLKAIGERKPTLSEPIALANNDSLGVLMINPLLNDDNQAIGVISAIVVIDNLLQLTLQNLNHKDIEFSFYHYEKNGERSRVYTNEIQNSDTLDPNVRTFELSFFDQNWQVNWQPKVNEIRRIYSWQINLFSTIGAIFVILIQYIGYRLVILNQTIQREVSKKTEELEQAKRDAEQASVTKGQFLANMSHEIRTPLNAILGFAELAKTESLAQKKQDYLDGIWSSSEALLSLVNDVLDFSKIEAGKLVLNPTRFSIQQIADRLNAIFSIQIRNKGLQFKFSYDHEQTYDIYADDARIQQILLNLCSNALKFTNEGFIRVALHVDKTTESTGVLRATVEDSGIGISEEEQPRIFEEFTQADASISRTFGGTGLGLAISHTLANILKGELTLRSRLGEGTAFQLVVPVDLKEKKRIKSTSSRLMTNRRILVVDDNPVNLKVTEALLQKSGFQVTTENNGFSAIESVYKQKPDLILMDMQMPELDGLETTRRIREFFDQKNLIIVGLTANAAKEDRDQCFEAGMNDHLSKPISMDKLSRCLTQWLS
jgi:signal transduction histidine kinase/BarA-like signal transduction histidine kinase